MDKREQEENDRRFAQRLEQDELRDEVRGRAAIDLTGGGAHGAAQAGGKLSVFVWLSSV